MPLRRRSTSSLDEYVELDEGAAGFWGNIRSYTVSLLKAYFGDAATADNDFCFDYLPRITGDHGTYQTVLDMINDKVKGYFLVGENPAVGTSNGKMQRLGLAKLDWLVVRDLVMVESATFWKDGPEIETGELTPEEIGTEVFFLPAAAHTEKSGTFTNTQRLLQWHHKAVEPPGDATSDLWFYYHLGLRIKEKLAGSPDPMDRPLLDLAWTTPRRGRSGSPAPRRCCGRSTAPARTARALSAYTQLKADGSTSCGCWIYCGVYADEVNQSARRKPGTSRPGSRPSGAGPGPPTAGSSTTEPRPTPTASRGATPRPTSGGTPSRAGGRDTTSPTSSPTASRTTSRPTGPGAGRDRRVRPVRHADRRQGLAVRLEGSGRRSAADALRAARVPGRATRATSEQKSPNSKHYDVSRQRREPQRRARSSRSCSRPTGSPSTTPPAG